MIRSSALLSELWWFLPKSVIAVVGCLAIHIYEVPALMFGPVNVT